MERSRFEVSVEREDNYAGPGERVEREDFDVPERSHGFRSATESPGAHSKTGSH